MNESRSTRKPTVQHTVIPAHQVVRMEKPRSGRSDSSVAVVDGPSCELVREDGVIRAIDVTCACGERIRIRCVYE
jgi:hypothetical protein